MFFLQSISYHLNKKARGVAQKGIYLKYIRNILIDLPPLSEQQLIVAKIQAAFSEVDKFITHQKERQYLNEMVISKMQNNLFVALHGSWNRTSKVGYKLIRVELDEQGNFLNVKDFVSGWLKNEKVSGRPSAPMMKKDGSLLLSDDKANVIYRITYSEQA